MWDNAAGLGELRTNPGSIKTDGTFIEAMTSFSNSVWINLIPLFLLLAFGVFLYAVFELLDQYLQGVLTFNSGKEMIQWVFTRCMLLMSIPLATGVTVQLLNLGTVETFANLFRFRFSGNLILASLASSTYVFALIFAAMYQSPYVDVTIPVPTKLNIPPALVDQ